MDASYVSTTEFSVAGDLTASFITDRRAKIDCGGDGIKYANIVSSTYSNPNTIVTVDEAVLTSNTSFAWYGVVQPGEEGSLPIHSHSSSEGDGGNITIPDTFLDLSDTPSSYSDTKFVKSTTSGVVWEDYNFEKLNGTPAAYDDGKYLKSTVSGSEWAIVPDQTTFDGTTVSATAIYGTSLFIDGDATVTGTIYAHEYDSYSPLIIKDAGTTVMSGTGTGGVVDFPEGVSVRGDEIGASEFLTLSDTPDAYTDFAVDTQITWLMQSDTVNGSTTFTDSSSYRENAVAWDSPPSPEHSTAQKKIGASSFYFPGNASLVSYGGRDSGNFGTGEYTIDCWVRFISLATERMFVSYGDWGIDSGKAWFFGLRSNNLAFGYMNSNTKTNIITAAWSPVVDTWYHVAVDRNSGTVRLYIDGSPEASIANSYNHAHNSIGIMMGTRWNYYGDAETMHGYIDEVRVVKGDARFAGVSFTPTTTHYSIQGAPVTFDTKQYLTINGDEDALEWEDHTILNLDDTPSSYSDGQYLRSTTDGTEWSDLPGQTTFSGTSLHVDGDATVTGTMYAHVYDSYSPLTIKDGGVDVLTGDGTGNVDFPQGMTVEDKAVTGDESTWHYGDGVPPTELGVKDDYYLDTTNNKVYINTGGALTSIDYDFSGPDGTYPDTRYFTTDTEMSTYGSIQNNKYELEIDDPGTNEPTLAGQSFLNGDFDIQFDFEVGVNNEAPTSNTQSTWLRVYNSNWSQHIRLEHYLITGSVYKYAAYDQTNGEVSYVTTDTSGKLRIRRVGTSLTFFVWHEGNQQWEWNGNGAGRTVTCTTEDFSYRLEGKAQPNVRLHTKFSNFLHTSGSFTEKNPADTWEEIADFSSITTFTGLTDTPTTYAGTDNYYLTSTGSGIAFTEAYDSIVLRAPDDGLWELKVTNSGTLYTVGV